MAIPAGAGDSLLWLVASEWTVVAPLPCKVVAPTMIIGGLLGRVFGHLLLLMPQSP